MIGPRDLAPALPKAPTITGHVVYPSGAYLCFTGKFYLLAPCRPFVDLGVPKEIIFLDPRAFIAWRSEDGGEPVILYDGRGVDMKNLPPMEDARTLEVLDPGDT